jgi:hypothetical protein
MSNPEIEYKTIRVKDIQLEAVVDTDLTPDDKAKLRDTGGRVIIDGQPIIPSGRFWSSLYSRFGLNSAFFRFFSHEEVFRRISEKDKNDRVRLTIERGVNTGDSRLLAATGVNKPVVVYDDLQDILQTFVGHQSEIRYHNGVVTSTHTPRIGQSKFKVGADEFSNRFELHCPVDGYGQPSVFLSLLRWICSNGAVGFARAFQTSLNLGSGTDNTRFALQRALDSFSNEEGYALLRGRFEMATKSWASINDQQELYRVLLGVQNDDVLRQNVQKWDRVKEDDLKVSAGNALYKAFTRMAGDPFEMYRSDPNMMSQKRRATMPVACRVSDMINFATELATHHVSEAAARQLQGLVGQWLSKPEYDLEDSISEFADWRDLFFTTKVLHKQETVG